MYHLEYLSSTDRLAGPFKDPEIARASAVVLARRSERDVFLMETDPYTCWGYISPNGLAHAIRDDMKERLPNARYPD